MPIANSTFHQRATLMRTLRLHRQQPSLMPYEKHFLVSDCHYSLFSIFQRQFRRHPYFRHSSLLRTFQRSKMCDSRKKSSEAPKNKTTIPRDTKKPNHLGSADPMSSLVELSGIEPLTSSLRKR
jgi:hypothetical protein